MYEACRSLAIKSAHICNEVRTLERILVGCVQRDVGRQVAKKNGAQSRKQNFESVSHEPTASVDFNICGETRVWIIEEGGINVHRTTKTYQSLAFKDEENTHACIVLTKREREAAN